MASVYIRKNSQAEKVRKFVSTRGATMQELSRVIAANRDSKTGEFTDEKLGKFQTFASPTKSRDK